MKPEYTLVKNLQGTYELRVGEFVIALFFDDGSFTRIPFVPDTIGVRVNEEGKIIEDHSISNIDGKPLRDHMSFVRRMRRKMGV